MIAITTRSSISVKARRQRDIDGASGDWVRRRAWLDGPR
jgi:hypothetical protein